MDQTVVIAMVVAAGIGLLAIILAVGRRRSDPRESPFARSTEGETRCPSCGMGNMWTDRTCISCGASLRG